MNMETREVSIPTPRAISASSTVARIMAPTRVFSIVSHRIKPMKSAMPIIKIRYIGK
jgi:hypothetical protein